jgi:hypothetical protein
VPRQPPPSPRLTLRRHCAALGRPLSGSPLSSVPAAGRSAVCAAPDHGGVREERVDEEFASVLKTTDGDTATRRRSMERRARKCGMPAGRTLRRDAARGVLHRAQRPLACTRVQIHWRSAARCAYTFARPRARSLRVGAYASGCVSM